MIHQLFINFKKAYDSVRRAVLYNILIEFGIPMKLVRHVISPAVKNVKVRIYKTIILPMVLYGCET
jgi:hypothetical protein